MVLVSKVGSQRALLPVLIANGEDQPGVGAIIARTLAAVATRYAQALAGFAARLEGDIPEGEIERQLHVISELRDTWEQLLNTALPHLADKCTPPILLSNCAELAVDGNAPHMPLGT